MDTTGCQHYSNEHYKQNLPSKEVAAMLFAHRVLGLVNTSDEHGNPDNDSQKQEQNTTNELEWSENSTGLSPHPDYESLSLSLGFSS
jgi:hypothetical protein